ncbi:carboxypeptidase family protein [Parvularcula sp. ZS-1/3]|uniref:Carboxypeptidase family protein n=1 Tax=Parvularcula mediterranea TaxID=2732508 RepID=A0A7Y3RJ79_9PROT|nr:carboxypeptidase family protein [Parvularcula mediterranea]NNU15089.1 carboxypeptidase family protein [Parvularcula mediterranea]
MSVTITSSFECGNIRVVSAHDPQDIRLEIESDGKADFFQWFFYRVEAPEGSRRMVIENAARASYEGGWQDYNTCASYDLENWFRVPSRYENGKLEIEHEAKGPVCYYAYFAPYTAHRAMEMTARFGAMDGVEWMPLGKSLDGRPVDALRFGSVAEAKKTIWVIARQHPGESMGSWYAEGFCEALTDPNNNMAQQLLREATVYVVPIMNPDGVARGHLRTNAAGTDLNRAWAEPSAEASPEVLAVRNKMDELGCDLFLDAHGDEAIANNFIAGSEGIPKWSPRLAELLSTFKNQLIQATPDFQDKEGYPIDPAGKANLRIANNQVGERFECLSMTLEMPFKDARTNAMPEEGWSPRRCKQLAVHSIEVMARLAERLR